MTRMKLNWCAQDKGQEAASKTFLYILFLFLAYIVVNQVLDVLMAQYAPTEEEVYGNNGNNDGVEIEYSTQWWAIYAVQVSLRLVFFLYFLLITIRTRQTIRNKYTIPTDQCGGCEDCWYVLSVCL